MIHKSLNKKTKGSWKPGNLATGNLSTETVAVLQMVFSLYWFAVHDHLEDILEHLDTFQVSETRRELVLIKLWLVKDIYLTYDNSYI